MKSSIIPTPIELQQDYIAAKALGSPLLASNGMLVPEGFDHLRLLISGFTRPLMSANDPAEANFAGGLMTHVGTVAKTANQMSVTIMETENGIVQDFAEQLLVNGGELNCWAYDGRPNKWVRRFLLQSCHFTFDGGGDMQADSRSQVVTVQATMYYTYFGQNESLGGGLQAAVGKVQALAGAAAALRTR